MAVAEIGDEIVGTLQLTFIPYLTFGGSLVAQIEAVHVAPHRRGRGIGESMMRWAIDQAIQRKCHRVQLTSDKRRKDAHRFYERLGFAATHEGMKLLCV